MGYIYKLTSPNGKSYIGQTIRPIEKRLEEHRTGESKRCRALYNAIKEYGWENFEKEWNEVPDDDLNFYEEMLVALLGTLSPYGYNLKEGGGNTGKPCEETRQKQSEAKLCDKNFWYGKSGEKHPRHGKSSSDETRRKQSEAHIGQVMSEETRKKISEAHIGKVMSEESRQKMSESRIGIPLSEETKQKMSDSTRGDKNHRSKRVYQYDLDGTFINSFGSTEEASRYLKISGSSIRACARGEYKTAYGFKWSYTKI